MSKNGFQNLITIALTKVFYEINNNYAKFKKIN